MASKTTVIKLLEVISKIADSAADRLEDGGKLGKADITALVDTLERIHSSLHQVKSHIYALTNGKKADTDKFKEKVGPLMRMKPKSVKSSLVETFKAEAKLTRVVSMETPDSSWKKVPVDIGWPVVWIKKMKDGSYAALWYYKKVNKWEALTQMSRPAGYDGALRSGLQDSLERALKIVSG